MVSSLLQGMPLRQPLALVALACLLMESSRFRAGSTRDKRWGVCAVPGRGERLRHQSRERDLNSLVATVSRVYNDILNDVMKSTAEWTVDVLMLVAQTIFTFTGICCVWSMWKMRKRFSIALRCPMLGCVIGGYFILRACTTTWVFGMGWNVWSADGQGQYEGISAGIEIIISPAYWVSIGAMTGWMVRLLVMYDPAKRKKWGRLTNEKRMFNILTWTYGVLEVLSWALVAMIGVNRTQREVMVPLDFAGVLLLLISAAILGPKLRKVHDICKLSLDAQKVIGLTIWVTVVLLMVYFVPMPKLAFKYSFILALNIAYQPIVFAVVIKPVRDVLRNDQHPSEADRVFLLPPWSWLRVRVIDNIIGNRNDRTHRVACTPELKHGNTVKSTLVTGLGGTSTHIHVTPLTNVMSFPPLKEAFGEYCTRALCSESFQFLVDASEYQNSVHAVHSGSAESKDDLDFGTFTTIVDEYIKDRSHSEININCSSKQRVMEFCDRAKYVALIKDERADLFLVAEKEIAKMLAENLLNSFKLTPAYVEIAADLEI